MARRQQRPSSSDAARCMTDTCELQPWHFAGLLTTYWCNARCAFCYLHCGPDRRGARPIDLGVRLWRELEAHAAAHIAPAADAVAGRVGDAEPVRAATTMRIHVTGGEPFGDWPRLAELLRAARDAGCAPADSIETNAYWATDDGETRARLEVLARLGVRRLAVSCDSYHQEHVPFERVRRCVTIAHEVFGPTGVRVRWWDEYHAMCSGVGVPARPLSGGQGRPPHYNRDRLSGRAAWNLAPLLPRQPAETFRGQGCGREVLAGGHVHIDPYGHIFPGVCTGIILGRAGGSSPDAPSIESLWQNLARHWREHPVLAAVAAGGSFALMQAAESLGFTPDPAGYASKCHLCTAVRQFLFERGHWPEHIGPAECYADGA